jgi:hypothetical protein
MPRSARRTALLAAATLATAVSAVAAQSPAAGRSTIPAPRCTPTAANASALLAGAVTVSPAPGSMDASPYTQISLRGVPAAELTGVQVVGSRSGAHSGLLAAYSQGDGASFLLSKPLLEGESVRVNAQWTHQGAAVPLAWSFTVSMRDVPGAGVGIAPVVPTNGPEYQRFRSRPDLRPPLVAVTADGAGAAAGEIMLAPYGGPGQWGPMILDEAGHLAWFKPLAPGGRAADVRVQSYEGRPVLTWWQDPLVAQGRRDAGIVIADQSYRDIAIVRGGNGYQPDLHEFKITPQGTALFTVFAAIRCDLSGVGGPHEGAVADTLLQEVDLKTGLVTYEWHSLDHVSLGASYETDARASARHPFDYFHINSIDVEGDGNLLVDARNTWAAYDVDGRTGQVRWQLGGHGSSFAMPAAAEPAFQHDARRLPDGDVTFFDNGATPAVHPQSRAIELALDEANMTATLVRSYVHAPKLVSASQGNVQALPGGGWMVGWGQASYFSEYGPAGNLVFDAHLPLASESYRVYRQGWVGRPGQPPAVDYVAPAGSRTRPVVYVSWNGATQVASWRILTGPSPTRLAAAASRPRLGFETAISLPPSAAARYVEAQALDATGAVIGASPATRTHG